MDHLKKESQENVEALCWKAFSKGVSMDFLDERVKSKDQSIRANPDGSENLVELDINTREWHLLTPLVGAGQGRWVYLYPHKYNITLLV